MYEWEEVELGGWNQQKEGMRPDEEETRWLYTAGGEVILATTAPVVTRLMLTQPRISDLYSF